MAEGAGKVKSLIEYQMRNLLAQKVQIEEDLFVISIAELLIKIIDVCLQARDRKINPQFLTCLEFLVNQLMETVETNSLRSSRPKPKLRILKRSKT